MTTRFRLILAACLSQGAAAFAQERYAELAKKLSNPVASLISVPFQSNFDFGMGPSKEGWKYTLKFRPVIPTGI